MICEALLTLAWILYVRPEIDFLWLAGVKLLSCGWKHRASHTSDYCWWIATQFLWPAEWAASLFCPKWWCTCGLIPIVCWAVGIKLLIGRLDKVFAAETVDSDLIPDPVKLMTIKVGIHGLPARRSTIKRDSVEPEPPPCVVVILWSVLIFKLSGILFTEHKLFFIVRWMTRWWSKVADISKNVLSVLYWPMPPTKLWENNSGNRA